MANIKDKAIVLYNAEGDGNIEVTAENMYKLTTATGLPIKTTYNDIELQIEPGTKPEQITEIYDKLYMEKYNKEEKSVEQEIESARVRMAAVDRMLAGETFDTAGFTSYFDDIVRKNRGMFGEDLDAVVRWGKLMQSEMKKQGLNHLTAEIAEETKARALPKGEVFFGAKYAMYVAWKHGRELAAFDKNEDLLRLDTLKACYSDRTQEFCDKFKSNSNDEVSKNAMILANIFQDEKLVDNFYNMVMLNKVKGWNEHKTLNELTQNYIPILSWPSNKTESLKAACDMATVNIQQARDRMAVRNPTVRKN